VYTQCPKCETIFKLSADVLRAAGGQVRCGRCSEVFNALARLAEDPGAFLDNESALDLEERADSILESAAALKVAEAVAKDYEDFVPPGIEIAQLQVLDYWADEEGDDPRRDRRAPRGEKSSQDAHPPDGSGDSPDEEIHDRTHADQTDHADHADQPHPEDDDQASALGDDETDEYPDSDVVTGHHEIALPTADFEAAADPGEPRAEVVAPHEGAYAAQELLDETSLEFTLPPGELDRIFIESRPRVMEAVPGAAAESFQAAPAEADTPHESGGGGGAPPESQPHPESAALRDRRAYRVIGLEVAESVRDDILHGLPPEADEELPALEPMHQLAPPRRRGRYVWLAAAIALTLLLGGQIAYRNAAWLATHSHGPMSEVVRALSGAMGTALPAPANLTAYQVRQWGVTGDPGAAGTLRVRASILNAAPQLQPYPLLRVTLADRFGKRIGSRDFLPAEYLGKPVARLLAPGERADAVLDILDPGKSAEGFEVDVCLRGAERTQCANDAASQVKP
jgi:predicted Zn finger-like uncharacterized protein